MSSFSKFGLIMFASITLAGPIVFAQNSSASKEKFERVDVLTSQFVLSMGRDEVQMAIGKDGSAWAVQCEGPAKNIAALYVYDAPRSLEGMTYVNLIPRGEKPTIKRVLKTPESCQSIRLHLAKASAKTPVSLRMTPTSSYFELSSSLWDESQDPAE